MTGCGKATHSACCSLTLTARVRMGRYRLGELGETRLKSRLRVVAEASGASGVLAQVCASWWWYWSVLLEFQGFAQGPQCGLRALAGELAVW